MKKQFLILIMFTIILLSSCADSKTFTIGNGANETKIHAEPYGWMNQHKKVDNVEYQMCVGNIVWGILLCETIVVPVILTGIALYEPIKYDHPEKTNPN